MGHGKEKGVGAEVPPGVQLIRSHQRVDGGIPVAGAVIGRSQGIDDVAGFRRPCDRLLRQADRQLHRLRIGGWAGHDLPGETVLYFRIVHDPLRCLPHQFRGPVDVRLGHDFAVSSRQLDVLSRQRHAAGQE